MNRISLANIVNGELQKVFDNSLEKIVNNLQDSKTSSSVKRELTIKFTFSEDENRNDISVSAKVTEKLAPVQDLKTSFMIDKDLRTGEKTIREYSDHIEGQMTLDEM